MGAISTVIMHKFPLPIKDIKNNTELDLSAKELISLDAIVLAALLPLNVSGRIRLLLLLLISLFRQGGVGEPACRVERHP
jgi:hypothetical protein